MAGIPYGKQEITAADIEAVVETLQHPYLTGGPQISGFETDFAAYIQADYAIAVANGTAALHLCALALGVGPGSRVLTTPMTFAASANCVRFCGGTVEFVDIDPQSWLMDLDLLEEKLKHAAPGTYQGIIAVDYAGRALDMPRLRKLADGHGCWIIEDACHAPGASGENTEEGSFFCGSGAWADLAIFSFHPVKHIACGEGGMVTTRNAELAERIRLLRNHGITRDPARLQQQPGGWYYEMQALGYNYRLSDIHAALGRSQLRRAAPNLTRRRELAARYTTAFASMDIRCPDPDSGHAWHLYIAHFADRKYIYDGLREAGIYAQVHYIPVHHQPYYQELGWQVGDFQHTDYHYAHCLSLPLYPSLSDAEQDRVIATIDHLL